MSEEQAKEIVTKFLGGGEGPETQVGVEGESAAPTGYISTRCPMLDFLIGKPGVPLGGISVLVGAYGTGKSSLVAALLAETQSQDGQAVLFDTEGRFNGDRGRKLGVDVDNLILVQPETLEETFDGVKKMIESVREVMGPDDKVLIAIDSIAGAPLHDELYPKKDGKGVAIGAQAKIIRREMRILSGLVHRQRIGLVITSQPRAKINLSRWGNSGSTTTWLGEDPLGHAAMTVIRLEEQTKLGDDVNSPVGFRVMATLRDTRIAGVERKGWRRTFDFYSASGIDFASSALDLLQEVKVIKYNRGWYKFKEEKPFRRADFAEKLEEWPELLDEIAKAISLTENEDV